MAKDKNNVITGETSTGFQYVIDKDVMNDWELLEDLTRFDSGEYGAMVPVMNRLLGSEQYKKMKEHCRDKETGRVQVTAMENELHDIFSQSYEGKNS